MSVVKKSLADNLSSTGGGRTTVYQSTIYGMEDEAKFSARHTFYVTDEKLWKWMNEAAALLPERDGKPGGRGRRSELVVHLLKQAKSKTRPRVPVDGKALRLAREMAKLDADAQAVVAALVAQFRKRPRKDKPADKPGSPARRSSRSR